MAKKSKQVSVGTIAFPGLIKPRNFSEQYNDGRNEAEGLDGRYDMDSHTDNHPVVRRRHELSDNPRSKNPTPREDDYGYDI